MVRQRVVGADVEHVHVALAARPGVARPLAGARDVQPLEVGRKREAVRIGHLLFGRPRDRRGRWDRRDRRRSAARACIAPGLGGLPDARIRSRPAGFVGPPAASACPSYSWPPYGGSVNQ